MFTAIKTVICYLYLNNWTREFFTEDEWLVFLRILKELSLVPSILYWISPSKTPQVIIYLHYGLSRVRNEQKNPE